MKHKLNATLIALACAALVAIALTGTNSIAEGDAAAADGKSIFLAQKCEMCHSVPSEGIEAKVKSASMKGPDIAGLSVDPAELGKFLRKQAQIDGKDHKKEFKGSDEELQTLVTWILAQK